MRACVQVSDRNRIDGHSCVVVVDDDDDDVDVVVEHGRVGRPGGGVGSHTASHKRHAKEEDVIYL